jgi:TonB family protein
METSPSIDPSKWNHLDRRELNLKTEQLANDQGSGKIAGQDRQPRFVLGLWDDLGPGAHASIASLALHGFALGALALAMHFEIGNPVAKPQRVTILQETRLFSPMRKAGDSRVASIGLSGDRRLSSPASKGITPPPTNPRAFFPPAHAVEPHPKLQVSPTLLDVAPPAIKQDSAYGSPQNSFLLLPVASGVPGFAGRGAEPGSAALGGPGAGQSPSGGIVYSMSDLSQGPVLLYKVDPDYSEQAKKSRYEGIVLLRLVIDENGLPRDIRVVQSLGLGLDEKAMEAVRHWRFQPGIKDGRAVSVDANVEVSFRLL